MEADKTPYSIPKAHYPADPPKSYGDVRRMVLREHPNWVNLSPVDALILHDRSESILERAVLNEIASDNQRREDAGERLTYRPKITEAYMHVRDEPKPDKAPAPARPVASSPRCTTASVLSIWADYPHLSAAGGLAPNAILALQANQLQFREACEFVSKKIGGGEIVRNAAGMVHGTLKRMVAR